jgi:hypothetical protein
LQELYLAGLTAGAIAGDGGCYRSLVTSPSLAPPDRLAALLETLPSDERQSITAWLLALGSPGKLPDPARSWPPQAIMALAGPAQPEERVLRIAATLATGEDSQLVTIRLPAERHTELRAWCAEHGFTMAAVVRGLVERFLAEHSGSDA